MQAPATTAPATTTAVPSPAPSTAPLTGVDLAAAGLDPAILDRPVLAVKIENTVAARPQIGLEAADVVFEEIVEGGITRFLALFHSTVPDTVGPIRSARLVDVELLPAYRPILGYSGAREEVTAALQRAGLALVADDGLDPFYRDPDRPRSHDLFASGAGLYARGEGLAGVTPAPRSGEFAPEPPAGAATCAPAPCEDPGTQIDVVLSDVATASWRYDAAAGVYRRTQVPDGDGEDPAIGAANVVALGMQVGPGGCCDTSGSPFTATQVLGEGRAIILREGRWYEARWRKSAPQAQLQLLDPSGVPFVLAPGASWVHLAPVENLPPAPGG